MAAVSADAVELTRALIQVDTSNPPGNETACAHVLRDWLASRGVASELVGPDPERLNLVATVDGDGTAPSLALCGHLDVVPAADPADWVHPPFSGALVDGFIHGRGAVDMKGQVATRAAALAALVQSGHRPGGTVRLIAQADEEVNSGGVGMSWLVRNRPDLRTDWALEEGGGRHMTLADGREVAFFGVADKALVRLEVHARGPGGHASRPAAVHNPVYALARLIASLESTTVSRHLVNASSTALHALAGNAKPDDSSDVEGLLAAAVRNAPEMAASLDAITRNTFVPTGLRGSQSINVIPAHATAAVDCRALPDVTAAQARTELEDLLVAGERMGDAWEVHQIGEAVGGSASQPVESFTSACTRALNALGSRVEMIPMMNPFYTDADHLRSIWGTVTYGFWPWKYTNPADYGEGIHAANERVLASDIEYAAKWHLTLLLAGLTK